MIKHHARSDYAKLSREAAALKEERARKLKRKEIAARTARRAKELNLKKLWSAADEERAASLRGTPDKTNKLPLFSAEAARTELRRRRKKRGVDAKRDLATGYATVIAARDDAERVNLAEACDRELGKKAYQNSSLFSLVLQAMGFEKTMASKRAVICRYALAMEVVPSGLLKFISSHGGLEKCLAAARSYDALLGGKIEAGVLVRSKRGRHVLFSIEAKSVVRKLWSAFKKRTDDQKKHSRVAAARIITKILKSYL